MSWLELHITASADQATSLSDQLTLYGAQAVTFQDAGDQPIYEPSNTAPRIWQETRIIGLFDYQHAMLPILAYLEKQQTAGLLKQFELKEVADEDWVRRSLESFKPLCFGKRLWICPSWHMPPEPTAINIILDPGLAFGTGTHPTTALCLEWLDERMQAGHYVIDYGCGSGILSLAALKLGAKHVLAIDNDPQALEAARCNAEKNAISPQQLSISLPETARDQKADLLLANILAKPLIDLAPHFETLMKPKGRILLSGILADQADSVISAYQAIFLMQPPVYKGEWIRLEGEKK